MKKTKPDKQLVKIAKDLGLKLNHDLPRRKDESMVDWRCRSWGIPKPTFQPIDDAVVVWRLPPLSLSAGGLVVPADNQSPHVKGILLAMGPRARDLLFGNGIELGHIVIFERFAGWEMHDNTPEYARHNQILFLNAKNIKGSDDLKAEMDAGRARYVQGEDGRHRLAVVETRKLLPAQRRKEKILAVAASTASEHEADTARKIAATMK
jgi:co-chaperonin GroES (HSP10)